MRSTIRLLLVFCTFVCANTTFSQTKTITGRVLDETAATPLSGVTVVLKGTGAAAVTDETGQFSMRVPANGAVLEASYIGYLKKQVTVGNDPELLIYLSKSAANLDEVVVVGYGTQKKVNLSGAVNTVDKKLLVNRPVTSLTNALQGTVPGMAVISRPGDVGNDLGSINVRGRGNLGTSAPLYVVDGVVVSGGDFARINPNDVESMSILKDASASAIYGSRAAYGVILVTTKKGSGAFRVNYNAYYGSQSAAYLPDFTDAYDYAVLYNEAETNAGRNPRFSTGILDTIRQQLNPDLYPNNNWFGLTLRKRAPMMEHQVSIAGGERVKYFLSGAYFLQNSLIPGKDLRRYSVRANTEAQVTEKLKLSSNISFIRDGFDNEKGTIDFTTLSRLTPLVVARQSDGNWGSINAGAVDAALASGNTLRKLAEGGRSSYATNRFIGTLNGTYTPVKGLDINGLFSYNFLNYLTSTFTNTMDPLINFVTKAPLTSTAVTTNQLDEQWQNTTNLLAQVTAGYSHKVALHEFRILAGSSYENFRDQFVRVIRKGFVNNDLNAINGGSANPLNTTATGNIQQRGFRSYFGRLNYAYDNKYLLEMSLRNDASSQFAPGHRAGWFPGASFAWRISQENFLKNSDAITELKLRLSAGRLGNTNNVGNYDFYDGLGTGTVVILDQQKQDGVYPAKIFNPLLSWEKVDMYNLGIDVTLWRKLNLQLDVFDKRARDILLQDPNIPIEAGLIPDSDPSKTQIPSINVGTVRNRGFEFSAGYNGRINDFSYTIGGNISKIWNKITELGGLKEQAPSGYYINRVGEAIGSFYMYEANGFYETDAEAQKYNPAAKAGDIRYIDQNKDNKINGDDRVIAGNDVPYFTYGINLGANYKNFDFALLGSGVSNVKVYLESEASQAFFNGAGVKKYVLDRWTINDPRQDASYPRLSRTGTVNFATSTFWLFNADYFRFRSLSVGYTIPGKLLERWNMKNLRIYVASNNPFTIRGDKRLKDFDPESASQRSTYPALRTYSFGLNLTL